MSDCSHQKRVPTAVAAYDILSKLTNRPEWAVINLILDGRSCQFTLIICSRNCTCRTCVGRDEHF